MQAVKLAKIGTLFALVHFGKTFSEAILMQFHENVHEKVAPEHVAKFLGLLWRIEKDKNKSLQVSAFAKTTSMTTEAVRKAVRFTNLPVSLQELVLPSKDSKKGLAYGPLCELARLQDAQEKAGKKLSQSDLKDIAYSMVDQYRTVKAAAMFVSKRIQHLEGQDEIFELSIQSVKQSSVKIVATRLEDVVKAGHAHINAVAHFHENKIVDSVLSGAATRATELACATITRDAPLILGNIKSARGAGKAKQALRSLLLQSK